MNRMTSRIFISSIICIALFLTSCSNEFELTEGSVDIPIVYGVISSTDTANYIRVERAFIDENISAYILSKDPAQLYYNDISVVLRHVKTNKDYSLQRVDGNLEGYQRAQGAFADAPNYLYKIKKSQLNLIGKDQYKLIVKKSDGTILTEATTIAITPYENADISNPSSSSLLSFVNNSDFKVRWFGDQTAVIHDVKLTFFYKELKAGQFSDKSVAWTLARNISKSELNVKGNAFYEFMKASIDVDPTIKRYFQNASLTIISGGNEIKEYISIGQANLGITSSGEIPVYTNLSNGGYGLFSAKTEFTRPEMGMANITLDSLRLGSVTKSLNFQ